MRTYSTLGRLRRQRRRLFLARAAFALAFAALLVLFAVSGYQAGVSQNRVEIERLEADLAVKDAAKLDLVRREAEASGREVDMRARLAETRAAYAADVPRGVKRDLLDLIEAKLDAGVDPDRLAAIIGQAGKERDCAERTETKRLIVRTPLSTMVDNAATFADARITVSGEGQTAEDAGGVSEAWFDVQAPVTLHFLMINGEVANAKGRLPLGHTVVLGANEYLFVARATGQPGTIELTAQRCAFP